MTGSDGLVHFGGALFARILGAAGIPSGPLRSHSDPRAASGVDLANLAGTSWAAFEALCGFGPFQRDLPDEARREAVVQSVRASGFLEWVNGLQPIDALDAEQERILADG